MKILIVDDSVSVRKALERHLAPRNYHVLSASSAEHAMELIANDVPNLVIADVVMPGINGFELTQRIKSTDRLKNVPVLLISGIVDAAVTASAKEAGAEGVVSKPFTPEDLFPRIDAALAKAPAEVVEAPVVSQEPVVASSSEIAPPISEPVSAPISSSAPAISADAPAVKVDFTSQLAPFLEKPEVETILIVATTVDASVLAEHGKALEEAPLIGTYVRTLTSISNGLGINLGGVDLHSFSLEYQGKSLFVSRINDTSALALIVNAPNVPSTVRYLTTRQMSNLQQAFA
jgi:CheY-like chemotaxis protein